MALQLKNVPDITNRHKWRTMLPFCSFIGCMLEDEGVYGSVHIGTGTNITLGGNIEAACHYDLIMTGASIVADGRTVLKDGKIVI